MPSLRPERRLSAELTGYRETENGPRELRVDLVDQDTSVTLASLTLDAALTLVTETLTAVIDARRRGRPPITPEREPGA